MSPSTRAKLLPWCARGIVIVGLAWLLPGHAAGQTAVSDGGIEQQVLAASRAWFEALMRADVEAVDRAETDNFITIQQSSKGVVVVNKEQQLAALRNSRADRVAFTRDLSSVMVRPFGSVAVLTGVAIFRGQRDGKSILSQAVIAEVWVNEDGRWRLAHFQPTDVPVTPPR